MADDWPLTRLGDVARVVHGFAFDGGLVVDNSTPDVLVTPGNFEIGGGFKLGKFKYYQGKVPSEYVLKPRDLVVTMTDLSKASDTLGYSALVPALPGHRFLHNQRIGKVEISNPAVLDRDFLYWVLRTSAYRNEVLASSTGTSIKHTAPRRIEAFCFRRPPISEQRAIARILSTLDDKIELNRRMNDTLEAIARALFKSWFVDFDPVRTKAQGRDPGLPKPLADLFPDRFEITDSHTAPAGWRGLRWGELVTLEYGKSLEGYAGEEKPFPVYGTNGRIGSCAKPLCENAGIIIGRKGAYRGVHWCSEPFFVIDTAFFVAAKVPMELRWAYYELLRRDINSMDSGSAIPSTSRADFYGLEVLTPPLELQQAFVRLLTPCWGRQDQNAAESRTLAALRDTLLPKLISGELRVKDAERLVGRGSSVSSEV